MPEWAELWPLLLVAACSFYSGYMISQAKESARRHREALAKSREARSRLRALEKRYPIGDVMGRFKTPMTSFTNYIKTDLGAPGPRMVPAAPITQEALEHVRKHWNLPEAQVGMWVLLQANGGAILMTDSNFQAKYTKAHTTY